MELGHWAVNTSHLSWVCPECCSTDNEVQENEELTEEEMLLQSLEMLASDVASPATKQVKAKKDKGKGRDKSKSKSKKAAKVPRAVKAQRKQTKKIQLKTATGSARKAQHHEYLGLVVEHAGFKVNNRVLPSLSLWRSPLSPSSHSYRVSSGEGGFLSKVWSLDS
jgi:hypothetical protein